MTLHAQDPRPRTPGGFSALQFLVVLGIFVGVAGVVGPQSDRYVERGQVARIIRLAERLTSASAAFYADTGQYPREYDMANYSGSNRELCVTQNMTGWDGPYLEKGFTAEADNPFGALHLYDSTLNAGNTGFDLDADGTNDVTSNACMLYLAGLSQDVAEKLDEHYDADVGGAWNVTGRFNWNGANERGFLLIFH